MQVTWLWLAYHGYRLAYKAFCRFESGFYRLFRYRAWEHRDE